ncbi:MAG: hypothetical protein ABFC56_05335 [Clostridiaceae bacterium]
MQNQQNQTELSNKKNKKILVVSVGHHTRLGDILEYALAGAAFETEEAEAFLNESWNNRTLLFAISADETSGKAQLHTLIASLREKNNSLEGCVCAAIADGAQGRLAHLDLLALLLAANGAGARLPARPLLEGDRELRYFSGGRESSFERYRMQARQLVERLTTPEATSEHPRVRVCIALEDGAAHDWRALLDRMIETRGGVLTDDQEPDETILVCENTAGMPEESTLSLLDGAGRLVVFLASPAMGSDLYIACLLERACLRGNYSLSPRGTLVLEGINAMEVPVSKRETERVKAAITI